MKTPDRLAEVPRAWIVGAVPAFGTDQAAALHEIENPRKLASIEPDSVPSTDIDDDSALFPEVLPVHQSPAYRAGPIDYWLIEGVGRTPCHFEPIDLAGLEQILEKRMVDELSATLRAVPQQGGLGAELFEGEATLRAL